MAGLSPVKGFRLSKSPNSPLRQKSVDPRQARSSISGIYSAIVTSFTASTIQTAGQLTLALHVGSLLKVRQKRVCSNGQKRLLFSVLSFCAVARPLLGCQRSAVPGFVFSNGRLSLCCIRSVRARTWRWTTSRFSFSVAVSLPLSPSLPASPSNSCCSAAPLTTFRHYRVDGGSVGVQPLLLNRRTC